MVRKACRTASMAAACSRAKLVNVSQPRERSTWRSLRTTSSSAPSVSTSLEAVSCQRVNACHRPRSSTRRTRASARARIVTFTFHSVQPPSSCCESSRCSAFRPQLAACKLCFEPPAHDVKAWSTCEERHEGVKSVTKV